MGVLPKSWSSTSMVPKQPFGRALIQDWYCGTATVSLGKWLIYHVYVGLQEDTYYKWLCFGLGLEFHPIITYNLLNKQKFPQNISRGWVPVLDHWKTTRKNGDLKVWMDSTLPITFVVRKLNMSGMGPKVVYSSNRILSIIFSHQEIWLLPGYTITKLSNEFRNVWKMIKNPGSQI